MKLQLFVTLLFQLGIFSGFYSQTNKLDSLLNSALYEKSDTSKAKTYYKIASFYLNKGMTDSCYVYTMKCLTISKKHNFLKGLAVASNYIGQVKIHTGYPDSAIYYFTRAKEYYQRMKDVGKEAGMLNNLGVVYKDQGNIFKALDCYFYALKIKEQLLDSVGVANAYHNIALVYEESGDTINSLKYHKRALEIRRKVNDQSGISASLVAIGLSFKHTKPERTLEYLSEAIKIAENLGEEEAIAIASYNIGTVYFSQGKIKACTDFFNRSLQLSKKDNNPKGVLMCLQALGQVELRENNTSKAISYLEEAYTISRTIDFKDVIVNLGTDLCEAYEKMGNYKKAVMYLKISNDVKDSLFTKESVRKLTSEGLKYEHEKEKLIAQKELEKKEALARAESFKKNLIIGISILFLVLVSVFSYSIYNRLKENRKQKLIIEEQQKEMIDSINYARRIQYALLAHDDLLKQNLTEHFILFKPKDIVSGDFYWATLKDNYFYLAVCDCTGHGVPGAFMSLLSINFLNEAINEKGMTSPGDILNHVREQLIKKLDGGRDGMDAFLLRIPVGKKGDMGIEYAAANNTAMLIRNEQTTEFLKDSMPVGLGERNDAFKTHTFEIKTGDSLYIYTDGFADQFGGPKGKKLKYKQLDESIVVHSVEPLYHQKENLAKLFENWRGNLEQVDDVCVVGVRF